MAKYVKTEQGYIDITNFALAPFKSECEPYLTFSSLNNFTLSVNDRTKHWDGTLEYFTSDKTWATWDGTSYLHAVSDYGGYVLYLRGIRNTVITGNIRDYKWVLNGNDIACVGNIENLLDYTIIESGDHPTLADSCYANMFSGCTALTKAPSLPATTLAESCYANMFSGCTALTKAPSLPATTLAIGCYANMFQGCTALTKAPSLPATMLSVSCYANMFQGCTALTQAPSLPATTLASTCYNSMFKGCTALTKAPSLPATMLYYACYRNMFQGCTALTQASSLPATTLAESCYANMFSGCTALTQASSLPATTLAESCYANMFSGCTALTKAPSLPATTLAPFCYSNMFQGCTSLKLSSTKTDEYTQEYRIPSSGNGITATDALSGMFASTGGTFTGTPEINTSYYLSSNNMVVRETEIATLNGYVKAMIEASEYIIPSSTSGSAKKFKITVDDTGTISATEVT